MAKYKRRNTPAFTMLAWSGLILFTALILIGLYTLDQPLMVKGYYLMGTVGVIISSFTVAKVVRDNQEDEDEERKPHIES
ncbi:YiaA/YiaB family inner membrane protein [Metabacillus fastidiosus]|uniref:YiaA/YiaB family inner membrane protein n=1 Tax=Metabacillus fastidiosus TaxID=1458 RepID=A0ABU6P2Q1_9BACI|nr:YiaA/YiaB family inner membrane protein [Metabacillus fastidiosus]MEC2077437.1 YiaA/YiaB family inner membrane protein [Metabacillus fastidiosus]MED4403561.1 YiaA/YiaB family inner membrane protein [Metabacillus fastidiosus]MED4455649.1 YiaA/YiaB family inner membrane protein [Metabacillus fastidiosus]MED4463713.1 YiaA/YiaB family inner membrane protein [Metabacillus fastidiosus]MED4533082.1 YiaA/YiaB family inner membrane protein [Metabacillus fastidiosus]